MKRFLNNLLNNIFPPDEIDQTAEAITLDRLRDLQRPRTLPPIKSSLALYDFNEEEIRRIIYAVKYRKRNALARTLGALLMEEWQHFDRTPRLLIPVPLTPQKRRARGGNQAAWIAEGFLSVAGPHFSLNKNALLRIRETKSQTKLPRNERKENVWHAFAVADKAEVHEKDILLIDDVATTGATLVDCTRALHAAGARSVACAVIASGA